MRLAATLLAVLLCVSMIPAAAVGAVGPAADGESPVSAPALDSQETETGAENCTFPVTRTDATGHEVTVTEEPERVVVLAPSAAQVLWDVGAREKVVGMPVNRNTQYLEGSEERENVVDEQGQPDAERVIGADPDLVLAPNIVGNDTVTQLRDAGLTVYKAGFGSSLADVNAKTKLYGRFVGQCADAQAVTDETNESIEEIRTAVEGRDRPRVLYHFYNWTAGNGTFIHETITVAGGENIAATAGISNYQEYNPEIVAEHDPEWIVVPSDARLPQGTPYENTTAVRENQTLVVDANLINQPGPRVVIPMRAMAETFHPEAFQDASNEMATEGEPTEATDGEPTETTTPAETTPAETTDGSGPGFTVVAAALALAMGAAFLRLRK
jgi:iron complex transport system substrate-binding protein